MNFFLSKDKNSLEYSRFTTNVSFRGSKSTAKPEVVKIRARKPPVRHVLNESERNEYQKLLGLHYPHNVYFGTDYGLDQNVIEAEQDSDF